MVSTSFFNQSPGIWLTVTAIVFKCHIFLISESELCTFTLLTFSDGMRIFMWMYVLSPLSLIISDWLTSINVAGFYTLPFRVKLVFEFCCGISSFFSEWSRSYLHVQTQRYAPSHWWSLDPWACRITCFWMIRSELSHNPPLRGSYHAADVCFRLRILCQGNSFPYALFRSISSIIIIIMILIIIIKNHRYHHYL